MNRINNVPSTLVIWFSIAHKIRNIVSKTINTKIENCMIKCGQKIMFTLSLVVHIAKEYIIF